MEFRGDCMNILDNLKSDELRAEYIPTFDELKEDILQSLSMMKMM